MTIVATIAPPASVDCPPPIQDPQGDGSLLFLVVIADHAEVEQLSMMSSLVTLSGGRLLVAIASPRLGFSTDAVVRLRRAMGSRHDAAALAAAVDEELAGRLTGYAIVELPYRDSPSAARRIRRIATAADRLARRMHATHLREWFPELFLVQQRPVSR